LCFLFLNSNLHNYRAFWICLVVLLTCGLCLCVRCF
jgi:hypothetical protein